MKTRGEKPKKINKAYSVVLISFKPCIVMPFLSEDSPPVRSLVNEVILC